MKVAFALDETGQASELGEMLKLAIVSCRLNTTLEPVVLSSDFQPSLAEWLSAHGVGMIRVNSPLEGPIRRANASSGYPLQAIGNFLRYETVRHLEDDYFLYCDCDVIFLADPRFTPFEEPLSLGPEDTLGNYERRNSGVAVYRRDRLLPLLDPFYAFVTDHLEAHSPGFDQPAVNAFFGGQMAPLDMVLNWRPYWGFRPDAVILHLHGVKVSVVRNLFQGIYTAPRDREEVVNDLAARSLLGLSQYFSLIPLQHPAFLDCSYYRELREIVQRTLALLANPIGSYWKGVREIVQTSGARRGRGREELLQRFAGRRLVLEPRSILLQVEGATKVRLLFEDPVPFFALSSLYGEGEAGRWIEASRLSSTVRQNVELGGPVIRDEWEYFLVGKVMEEGSLDIVFPLEPSTNHRRYQWRLLVPEYFSLRIYWTRNGFFEESQSTMVSLMGDGSPIEVEISCGED